MSRYLLLAGALVALAPAAFAAPGGKPTPKTKKPVAAATINCPVMAGRKVNIKDATAKHLYADYKGNRYYFCCTMCPKMFKANPAKYAKGPHLPTPKK